MTTDPAFTIMLPIVRSPELMGFAIQSVLAQTRADFELLVICDGAPPETIAAASAAAAMDPRLRVFPFPKGERHGEGHRHTVLQQARGQMVCQIADDDLWFPDHLAEMALLLGDVEFGNTLATTVLSDDRLRIRLFDLADRDVQARMLAERWNFFGPTVTGYRLATYRQLPVGWSPAPRDIWTDLAMWRKFLSHPNIRVGTRFTVTSLHFPALFRTDWPLGRRRAEIARYAELARSGDWRDSIREQVLRRMGSRRGLLGRRRTSLSLSSTQPAVVRGFGSRLGRTGRRLARGAHRLVRRMLRTP
jgi:glycosyltransferase involved in cell wall biosynthesis